ncbi:hypothetical protein KTS45_12520 [Halomicroarcula limicola]|uniref:Uncharacterized protein n=1 Tax=Haloarcula limicola TaxID=1429915 RepID=A0A8J7YAF7_9EURY|nr:hypothetical protein [Halomicroarcula limicola]MBV0925021.1 hypothetical protein [Halomicroarcula limicola]
MINRQTILSFALVALVLGGGLTDVVSASNSTINYEEGPDAYIYEERVDVAAHNMTAMDSPLQYYGDNGELRSLNATQNSSLNETVMVRYDKIDDEDLRKFPRSAENGSALDAGNWTTSSASVSSTSTSLTVSTSGIASGSSGTATYDRVSIDSDPSKRVLFTVFNVDQLDSAADVTIRAVDSDGDYKAAEINSSASTDSTHVAATGQGNGYVFQQKLVDLPTEGSGDGTFDNIESVEIVVSDADASVTLTGLDVERKSTIELGETYENGEATSFTEVDSPGEVGLTSLDTLPSMFDDATIEDLGVLGIEYRASDQPASDISANYTSADNYAGYPSKLDLYQRITVPTAIDISHHNLELRTEQKFISERYKVARMAEGTGDTDFENISSWSDLSSTYNENGATHVLDASIQPGQSYVVNTLLVLQDDEVRMLQDTSPAGGAAPVSDGGIFGSIWTWITGAIATLSLGYVKLRGGE